MLAWVIDPLVQAIFRLISVMYIILVICSLRALPEMHAQQPKGIHFRQNPHAHVTTMICTLVCIQMGKWLHFKRFHQSKNKLNVDEDSIGFMQVQTKIDCGNKLIPT